MNLDGIIEDLSSKNTPLCKATFEKMCNAVLDNIYPIGISIIFHDNEDHSNFLGMTWERALIGLTPVGYNPDDEDFNEIGKTGGSKELQKHKHVGITLWGNVNEYMTLSSGDNQSAYHLSNQRGGFFNDLNALQTASAGDGDSGNLQPYEVVAFWKRVA